jgi:hypothetical protein
MKCHELLALLTLAAVAPYLIEAASRWIPQALRRIRGARLHQLDAKSA